MGSGFLTPSHFGDQILMPTISHSGAAASTVSSVGAADMAAVLPDYLAGDPPRAQRSKEQIRHLLFGTPSGIQSTIQRLHQLGYAEPNDWSRPISTGRPNEVMAILTKRMSAV